MEKGERKEQLGNTTLGFVVANVVHMRRFMPPDTKLQTLWVHFSVTVLGWFGGGGKGWGGEGYRKVNHNRADRFSRHVPL